MDALLAGCFMACLLGTRKFETAYEYMEKFYPLALIFLFVISLCLESHLEPHYDLTLDFTLNALAGSFFVLWLARNERHLLGKVANSRSVTTVGVMSYSIYLWQTTGTHFAKGFVHSIAWLSLVALAATASFYLIEKTSLMARAQLEQLVLRRKHILVPEVIPAL